MHISITILFARLETMILKSDYSEMIHYDSPDYPIYTKYCVLSSYPNYAAPSHWHDDIEFIAIISGEMQYNVNGKIVTLHPGEGILVNSCQMHYGYSTTKKECHFFVFFYTLCCFVQLPHTNMISYFPLLTAADYHSSIYMKVFRGKGQS